MADDSKPIIGADYGRGGGGNTDYLPVANGPTDILLFPGKFPFVSGEGFRGNYMDIFGLDPRLNVACAFFRRPGSDPSLSFPWGNITVTIHAYTLTKSAGQVIEGPELPPDDLFLNGGNLDAASKDDGCELVTAAQGVRFRFIAQRTDATSVDVVAQIQARPNDALVCRDLAKALLEGIVISLPTPGVF